MSPKHTKRDEPDDHGMAIVEKAVATLHQIVETLGRCASKISVELDADNERYVRGDADHLGELGRHVAAILSEARKAEAERRKQAELSPSQIDEYIKRAGPDQLAQIQRSLSARSNKRSVLS